jgi:F-type H+-transporting ATPase subunit b
MPWSLTLAAGITEVNPGLTFWTLVTFIVLAFVLGRLVWPRIIAQIDERAHTISGALEAAAKERAEAEKRLADAKQAETSARREAAEEIKRIQAEGGKMREELRRQAEREISDMKLQAAREVREEKSKAAAELKAQVADLAIDAAKRLIVLSMDDKQAKRLVDEYVESLSADGQGTARQGARPEA